MKHLRKFESLETNDREWNNIIYNQRFGGFNIKYRDASSEEKIKLLGVHSIKEFGEKYLSAFIEIGKHYEFGNFVGLRQAFHYYTKIALYYEVGVVYIDIHDFQSFPNTIKTEFNSQDAGKQSYSLENKLYIPKDVIKIN